MRDGGVDKKATLCICLEIDAHPWPDLEIEQGGGRVRGLLEPTTRVE